MFLQCHHPAIRPFFEWRNEADVRYEFATADDVPGLLELTELHEGRASRDLAVHWLKRQLDTAVVARDASTRPTGLLIPVSLDAASAEEIAVDPCTAACDQYLRKHAPLRPGERAIVFRFWGAREGYQTVSAVSSVLRILMLRHSLVTPRLAFIFVVQADPEYWASFPSFIEMPRLHEADFEVGGHRYGVISIDWRKTPPAEWLRQIARKASMGAPTEGVPRPPVTEPLVVLAREAFDDAVREALKHLQDAPALGRSPLLRSKLVLERSGAAADVSARVVALQTLIQESIVPLATTPRRQKLYRALDRTYLRPAETQEAAAELLGIPFSTYRRHLTASVEWLAEALWARELGDPGP